MKAAPVPSGLSPAEAARLQRYHDRLLHALQERDRAALREAKHAVVQAAYRTPAMAAGLRGALRLLCWRMAAWRLPRGEQQVR